MAESRIPHVANESVPTSSVYSVQAGITLHAIGIRRLGNVVSVKFALRNSSDSSVLIPNNGYVLSGFPFSMSPVSFDVHDNQQTNEGVFTASGSGVYNEFGFTMPNGSYLYSGFIALIQ